MTRKKRPTNAGSNGLWFEPDTAGAALDLSHMSFAGLGTVLLTAFIVVYRYKKRRQ